MEFPFSNPSLYKYHFILHVPDCENELDYHVSGMVFVKDPEGDNDVRERIKAYLIKQRNLLKVDIQDLTFEQVDCI